MNKKIYQLQKYRDLFWLRAAVGGKEKPSIILRLLLDTGSSFTVLPVSVVKQLGCDLNSPLKTVTIITAGGVKPVPIFSIPWFSCLGYRQENFKVAALTLPITSFTNGLLGIDFLRYCNAVIDVRKEEIYVS